MRPAPISTSFSSTRAPSLLRQSAAGYMGHPEPLAYPCLKQSEWLTACELVDIRGAGKVSKTEAHVLVRLFALGTEAKPLLKEVYAARNAVPHSELSAVFALNFPHASISKELRMLEQVRDAFEKIDRVGNCSISLKELTSALKEVGAKQETAAEVMVKLDASADGHIQWDEFVNAMTQRDANGNVEEYFSKFRLANLCDMRSYLEESEAQGIQKQYVDDAYEELSTMSRWVVRLLQVFFKRYGSAASSWCWCSCRRARSISGISMRQVATPRTPALRRKTAMHSLTDQQRAHVRYITVLCELAACLVGAAIAVLNFLTTDWSRNAAGQNSQSVKYYTILILLMFAWTVLELAVMYGACFWQSVTLTDTFKLKIWPATEESVLIAGSLARAALEEPHPRAKRFGIDPSKRTLKGWLALATLLYAGKRWVTRQLLKLIIKKAAPRAFLRVVESLKRGLLEAILAAIVNIVWNFLTVRSVVRETIVCCTGPSVVLGILYDLISKYHLEDEDGVSKHLPHRTKLLMMRAVGVTVACNGAFHPNLRHMMSFMATAFVTKELMIHADNEAAQDSKDEVSTSISSAAKHLEDKVFEFGKDVAGVVRGFVQEDSEEEEDAHELGDVESINDRFSRLRLDSDDAFYSQLPGLQRCDADIVLGTLVLACAADGYISTGEQNLLTESLQACQRQGNLQNLRTLAAIFTSGGSAKIEHIEAVIADDSSPIAGRCARCNQECMRVIDLLNCGC